MNNNENQQMDNGRKEDGVSRGQRLRQRLAATANEESVAGLEQIFEAKLAAVGVYEKQLATVTDPYARKTLQHMIRQERQELLRLSELIDLVETSPDMGRITQARRRFSHRIKTTTGKDAGFWLGAAVVGAMLIPGVREQIRPLAVKTVQGVMELSEQVKGLFGGVSEELEDLVSEAQFEKLKQSIDASIMDDITGIDAPTDNLT